MPIGCGEQTMIRMAPNVYIFKYLKSTGQDTPEIEQKAIKHIEDGEIILCYVITTMHMFLFNHPHVKREFCSDWTFCGQPARYAGRTTYRFALSHCLYTCMDGWLKLGILVVVAISITYVSAFTKCAHLIPQKANSRFDIPTQVVHVVYSVNVPSA